VLDAVLSGDISRVKPLLRFYSVGCVGASQGIGSPPLCAPGAPVGAPIDVFPNASCPEGRFSTRADVDVLLPVVSNSSSRVFAVYRQAPKPPTDTEWPRGAFGIVLTTPGNNGPGYSVSRLEVDAGQVVLAGVLCPGDTAQHVLDNLQVSDFVLPPPQ
jgi:hypothetical protein